jgi:hypothetical protein
MRQNKKWWICAGAAFVLALSAFLFWNFLSGAATPQEESPSAVETVKPGKKRIERRRRLAAVPKAQGKAKGESVKGEPGEQGGDPGAREESRTEEGQAETEEAFVNAFDALTDKWLEPSGADVPMAEIENFRQQFNKIPHARKEGCLQRALNLLPDENIMLLAGILLDKGQPTEFTELVFNDILNREDSVKKPILKEIFKDKSHPCWTTAAWILDVTGEKPGK